MGELTIILERKDRADKTLSGASLQDCQDVHTDICSTNDTSRKPGRICKGNRLSSNYKGHLCSLLSNRYLLKGRSSVSACLDSDALIERLKKRRGNAVFRGAGIQQSWQMKREMLSPCYTTQWAELPHC
ncbi:DUF4113 domain-containing protein [Superficieibacter sp. 1612_C1]|uniref:DUF4113 domain-containing protein n=1 Tax=Superficieibacter sp. 1612_C1 TaxID=2780382 RepID=UPI001883BE58